MPLLISSAELKEAGVARRGHHPELQKHRERRTTDGITARGAGNAALTALGGVEGIIRPGAYHLQAPQTRQAAREVEIAVTQIPSTTNVELH